MNFKLSPMAGFAIIAGLTLSACSSTNSSQMQKEPAVASVAPVATGIEHTHPANICTNSISHSHPSGDKKHAHRYDCSPTKNAFCFA